MDGLQLARVDYYVYSDVAADPSEANVQAAIDFAREHKVDGVTRTSASFGKYLVLDVRGLGARDYANLFEVRLYFIIEVLGHFFSGKR